MHTKVRELRQKRAKIIDQVSELRKAKDVLEAADLEKMNALLDEAQALAGQIEADERMIDEQAALAEKIDEGADDAKTQARTGEAGKVLADIRAELAVEAYFRRKVVPVDAKADLPELAFTVSQRRRLAEAGISRSEYPRLLEAAQTVGTDSSGGYTVPERWGSMILEGAERESGMLKVGVTRVTLDNFGQFHIVDDANEIDSANTFGYIVGENAQITETTTAFGERVISPYKLTSGIAKVPWELLRQSGYDLAGYYGKILARRIGTGMNRYMTIGSGSSQPWGVVPRSSAAFTSASATAITWQEMIRLYTSLRRTWAMNASWMFSRATLGSVMQMVDPSGQPVLTTGIALRAPDMLLGRPIVINDQVEDLASAEKSVLFGDFSQYFCVSEATVQTRVLNERYADMGQVAFLAHLQFGGDLANSAAAPIKHIVQKT